MFKAILGASLEQLGVVEGKRRDYEKIKVFVLSELYMPNGAPKEGMESMQEIVKRQCEKLKDEVADELSELKEEERDGLDESLAQAREISAMEKFQKDVERLLAIVIELPERPFGEESSPGFAKFGAALGESGEDIVEKIVKKAGEIFEKETPGFTAFQGRI